MKTILKWSGIVLGGLVAVFAVTVVSMYALGANRLNDAPAVTVRTIAIPTSAEALERGRHLVHTVTGCAGCHTSSLGGKIFIDEQPIGLITAPNLTSGKGGVAASYTNEDWIRAIRHGVGKDGRALGGMPSDYLSRLSDDDLGAIIAYVKAVAPVDNELPARRVSFVGTILFGVLGYDTLPVVKIDHVSRSVASVTPEVSVAYGEYLTTIASCGDCHGANLAGYAGPPGPPPGPDLTRNGRLGSWTEADFVTLLRSGRTPEGNYVSEDMPWRDYAGMTQDELAAIWLYLQSLPSELATGN